MSFIDKLAEKVAEAVAQRVTSEIIQHIPDIIAGVAQAVTKEIPGIDIDGIAGAVVSRSSADLSSRIPFFRGI